MKLTIPFIYTYVTNYSQNKADFMKKKGLKCTHELDQNYCKCVVLFRPDCGLCCSLNELCMCFLHLFITVCRATV